MRILIADEKHGSRYFNAEGSENLHRACKQLLSERLENGYYNPEYCKPKELLMSEEDIENLPVQIKAEAVRKNESLKSEWSIYNQELAFYNEVLEVVNSGIIKFHRKNPISYCLLDQRDYEYEMVRLETLELGRP